MLFAIDEILLILILIFLLLNKLTQNDGFELSLSKYNPSTSLRRATGTALSRNSSQTQGCGMIRSRPGVVLAKNVASCPEGCRAQPSNLGLWLVPEWPIPAP